MAGTPLLTVSFWNALRTAVNSWLGHWGFGASPAAVSAGAQVLASDWNTKVRDPLNQTTYTYTGGVIVANSLGVATAASGDGVGKSGLTSADAVAKMNSRKCTTVYLTTHIFSYACTCNYNTNLPYDCCCEGN